MGKNPDIMVTHEDLAVLSDLVRDEIAAGCYVAASRLADELHRARVVSRVEVPTNCLILNVPGSYIEERSGGVHDVTLVIGKGRMSLGLVSVLSRVGTALLGLSVGQRMAWLDPLGRKRVVRLLEVRGGDPWREKITAAGAPGS